MPSFKKSAFKGYKILITSGPASVPIDDMRVITNRSTGEMGRLLAAGFKNAGARVTMLEGAVTTGAALPAGVQVKRFYFFDELAVLLKKELERGYDLVVHAAAVADFSLKKPFKGKLASGHEIKLELKPTRKLIADIKKNAPKIVLVGFKFEADILKRDVVRKVDIFFNEYSCDLVVLNQNDAQGYAAIIISADNSRTKVINSKKSLVNLLLKQLSE